MREDDIFGTRRKNNSRPRRNVDRTSGAADRTTRGSYRSSYNFDQGKKYDYFPELGKTRHDRQRAADPTEGLKDISSSSRIEDIYSGSTESIDDVLRENDRQASPRSKSGYDRSGTTPRRIVDRTLPADHQPVIRRTGVSNAPKNKTLRGGKRGSDNEHAHMTPQEIKKSKRRRILKRIGTVIASLFFIGIITGCIVVGAFGIYVFTCVDDSLDFDLNDLKMNYTTTIYVKDKNYKGTADMKTGEGWVEYQNLSSQNRIWVSLDQIDIDVINAFVSAEDQRFYTHNGVDWKRTFSSFVNLFLNIYDTKQGGSTITQQLVKNLTGDDSVDAMRKIREIMRARTLEMTYSKDTIMENYLNIIYMNNNCYGVEAASQYYFGKSAEKLDYAEAACLAAITKSPAYYDPISNPENNKSRRNWILNKMYELGYIEKEEDCTKAKEEELKFVGAASSNKSKVFTYFTDTVIEDVIKDLMKEKDCEYTYAENIVLTSGLRIFSTCDTTMQTKIEKVFKNGDNFAKVYGTSQKAQGAMTVMDYKGHVVAIAGGRGKKTESRVLNRAYQSRRQPGSSIKPIAVYGPALQANVITYSTLISNDPLTIGGYSYKNDDGSSGGSLTIQKAVERSINRVACRVLNKYGTQKSFNFVTGKLGLNIVKKETINGVEYSDIGISQLGLGALTHGVTTYEMTAAFAIFGNGGYYYEPTTYYKVTDMHGETMLEYKNEPVKAIDEDTSYVMNRILRTPVTGSQGTAGGAAFGNWEIIGKTGTTSQMKDRWFVGATPYYVGACWFGCDNPVVLSLSTRSNPAMLLWQYTMKSIHSNLKVKTFSKPSSVTQARYCTATGLIAGDGCPGGAYGYYKKSYMPACTKKGSHGGGKTSSSTSSKATSSKTTSSATSSKTTSSTATSSETSSTGDSSTSETSSKDTSTGTEP